MGRSVRNMDGKIEKVGILPYRVRAGTQELEFLVYQPVPKLREDRFKELPFQLARGTIEPTDATHFDAAKREALEELGVESEHIHPVKAWEDHGVVQYAKKDGAGYPIHFYSVRIEKHARFDERPRDANATKWATRAEIGSMVDAGTFKQEYVSILDAMAQKMSAQSNGASR